MRAVFTVLKDIFIVSCIKPLAKKQIWKDKCEMLINDC